MSKRSASWKMIKQDSAPYYMSKHAVLSLSESIYHELKMLGAKIGISALCPEIVGTNIDKARRNRPAPLQRKGPPPAQSDIVEAALKSFIGTGTPPAGARYGSGQRGSWATSAFCAEGLASR